MAYSDNFPAVRPVFQSDFANGGKIDPRATFSRASTGTFVGTDKVLSSENLLLQSQSFDTTWGTGPGHLTGTPSGGQTAPDGTSTAFIATADTSGSSLTPYVNQTISLSASTTYTMVGHLKAGTATHGFISFRGSNGNSAYAMVNFSGGTVSHGSSGDFTSPSSSVTALGSSWFRVTLTATTGTSLSSQVAVIGISDGTAPSSAGYASYVPSGETLYLWGAQISSTNTNAYDSPTTTQIARSYQTKLQTAASGAARFEHSATDGQSMGCLIEGQSTNLLAESTDFSGSWQILNASKSLEAIAPNGALNAIAFREGTNSSEKRLLRYYTGGGGSVTISIYAKILGNARRLVIREANASAQYATFDLVTGTKVSGLGSIESVGNGWFRCQLNLSTTGTTQAAGFYTVPADGNYEDREYAGDGYSGLLLAMPQAEDQSHASRWISTTSSTATRAADSMSIPIADTGYTGGPVSVNAEFNANSVSSGTPRVFSLKNGSNVIISYVTSGGSLQTFADVDGTNSVNASVKSGLAANTDYKMAISYGTDDYQGACGGDLGTSDTACALPDLESGTLYLGSQDGSHFLNGNLKRLSLFSEALTDANLQAITS